MGSKLGLFVVAAVGFGALALLAGARGGVKVSIRQPGDGSELPSNAIHEAQLSPRDEQAHFQVLVENDSRQPLDFYDDGSSWGDPTLTLLATTPDGIARKLRKEVAAYTKNAPGLIHVLPGQVWVREVLFDWPAWSKLSGLLHTAGSIKLQAVVTQAFDPTAKHDKDFWVGRAESKPVEIRIR
jgi:hypothetical protein